MIEQHIFTDLFDVRRYFTHLLDITLPFSVPLISGSAAAVTLFIEWRLGILGLARAVPAPLNLVVGGALPTLAWMFANKPKLEGKPVQVWVLSQLRYWVIEPKEYIGAMERVRGHRPVRRSIVAWSPRH